MQDLGISPGQASFIRQLLAHGQRIDGRSQNQIKEHSIQKQVLSLSEQSCRVFWGFGSNNETEVLVSSSIEILEKKDRNFSLTVNCLKKCIGHEEAAVCDITKNVLSSTLENSNIFDPEKLNIKDSDYCWVVYLDVLFIQASGSLYEAALYGINNILSELVFPELIVKMSEHGKGLRFEVDETKEPIKLLDNRRLPLLLSYSVYDETLFCDPTTEEISATSSLIVVSASQDGKLLGLNKFGDTQLKLAIIENIIESELDTLREKLPDFYSF